MDQESNEIWYTKLVNNAKEWTELKSNVRSISCSSMPGGDSGSGIISHKIWFASCLHSAIVKPCRSFDMNAKIVLSNRIGFFFWQISFRFYFCVVETVDSPWLWNSTLNWFTEAISRNQQVKKPAAHTQGRFSRFHSSSVLFSPAFFCKRKYASRSAVASATFRDGVLQASFSMFWLCVLGLHS